MKHKSRLAWLAPLAALGLATLACTLFSAVGANPPAADPHAVETSVAATVQALQGQATVPVQPAAIPSLTISTPAANLTPAPTTTPTAIPALLPSALYFIGPDRGGLSQVFRLAPQGNSVEQMTSEVESVADYAVSSDGKLAYTVNNQLILKRPGYSGTAVIVDGGKDDGTDAFRFQHKLSGLAWSPDGQTLAYGLNGINLYHLASGAADLAVQNQVDQQGDLVLARSLYIPESWSPNGSRLAVFIQYYEGGTQGIFNPNDKQVLELHKPSSDSTSCCGLAWTSDSSALLSAGYAYGASSSALWRYDVSDGKGTELIPSQDAVGSYNYVAWPMLAEDEWLYYFFAHSATRINDQVAYQMVRSKGDFQTNRATKQIDPLLISEAIWAPDGSLALIVIPAQGEATEQGPHGPIAILPQNGMEVKQIVSDGRRLQWGP